jgi:HEAT repeat protein
LGLTREHVPELIRLLSDPEVQEYREGSAGGYWPPMHAWRALGQLQAEEALQPLFTLLEETDDEDDWRPSELPQVLGMIGPAAISPARRLVAREDLDEYTRYSAMHVLTEVATRWPDARDQAVEVLTAFLRNWPDQDPEFNSFVIAELVDMSATEAAPLMAAAFEADAVDLSMEGDWEDVQVRMGLLPERITPRPSYFPFRRRPLSARPAEAPPKRGRWGQKAKNRRKDARASRKRNRRK